VGLSKKSGTIKTFSSKKRVFVNAKLMKAAHNTFGQGQLK
jgi:hypothetical protein